MRTIRFVDDGASSEVVLEVSADLAGAVARAASIGYREAGAPPISFSSLFIGLAATPDPTGEWLRKRLSAPGCLEQLLARRGLNGPMFDRLSRLANPDAATDRTFGRTLSARAAVTEGERIARAVDSILDTRHVFAAYLSLPAYHEEDFRDLEIDRLEWATSFSYDMASSHPDESQFWSGLAGRIFTPDVRSGDVFDLKAEALEKHIAGALSLAVSRAGDQAVSARDVLEAILSLNSSSPAFHRIGEMTGVVRDRVDAPAPPEKVHLHESLARQLAYVQRPKADGSEPRALWGRDLVTAVLLCDDPDLARMFEQNGGSLDLVRDRWFGYISAESRHRSRDEWVSWWSFAGFPVPGERLSGLATETDQGEDKLGIENEARAFARLILDRKVQPPLSIGLLGDWGSGKSFFIEQIKKQIDSLKKQARPELFGNVVEIEFNAWHASDSNLWASLVTCIFDEVWARMSGDQTPEKAQESLIAAIGEARGAVFESEGQVQLARAALVEAEKELETRRADLALDRYVEKKAVENLKRVARQAGWHQAVETVTDVEQALRSLTASGKRLQLVLAGILERPFLYVGLPFIGLALGAGAINSLGLNCLPEWAVTGIATVGALLTPIKLATSKVDELAQMLTNATNEYQSIADSTSASESGVRTVGDAKRAFEAAEAGMTAAKARLSELMGQQMALDPRRRLSAFLEDRVQSTVYRSQQGIISLVHRDFQQLSKFMAELRKQQSDRDVSWEHPVKPLERIVLYVDDLDRCRPAHVVNMLEAVHLLLALDLFVVVVAVDSRWLSRALELHYKELLGSDADEGLRASTPQNYLEKIFQVTYALGPMNPDLFKNYVAFLAGADEAPATSDQASASGGIFEPTDRKAGDGFEPDVVRPERDRAPADPTPDPRKKVLSALTPPSAVRIDRKERDLLSSLVPLLPTPRIAKRLVNVYRLIKASKTASSLEEFEVTNRPRSNLLMLAILFGKPAIASELLRKLYQREAPFNAAATMLREAIRNRVAPPDEPKHVNNEWHSLLQVLDRLEIATTVEECAREPLEIARYSLVSGNDWHTWVEA